MAVNVTELSIADDGTFSGNLDVSDLELSDGGTTLVFFARLKDGTDVQAEMDYRVGTFSCSKHTEISGDLINDSYESVSLRTYIWFTGVHGKVVESRSDGISTFTIDQGILCPDFPVRIRFGAKSFQTLRHLTIQVNGSVVESLEMTSFSTNTYRDFDVNVNPGDTLSVQFETGFTVGAEDQERDILNVFTGTFRSQ